MPLGASSHAAGQCGFGLQTPRRRMMRCLRGNVGRFVQGAGPVSELQQTDGAV